MGVETVETLTIRVDLGTDVIEVTAPVHVGEAGEIIAITSAVAFEIGGLVGAVVGARAGS